MSATREGVFFVVRVFDPKDPFDTHAADTLEDAMELASPDPGSKVRYCQLEAPDAGAARLAGPRPWSEWLPLPGDIARLFEVCS